jgi:hypothetical protein
MHPPVVAAYKQRLGAIETLHTVNHLRVRLGNATGEPAGFDRSLWLIAAVPDVDTDPRTLTGIDELAAEYPMSTVHLPAAEKWPRLVECGAGGSGR